MIKKYLRDGFFLRFDYCPKKACNNNNRAFWRKTVFGIGEAIGEAPRGIS